MIFILKIKQRTKAKNSQRFVSANKRNRLLIYEFYLTWTGDSRNFIVVFT